jgi:predicted glycoside hydrolase/deacetylase ChbG (UPF0249 family)
MEQLKYFVILILFFQTKVKKYGTYVTLFLFIAITSGCGPAPLQKEITGDKYLIINGDDLCMNEETDRAILQAYRNGILTSTSAFINLPGSVEKLKQIHSEYPHLPIGLHLNLTFGKPVLQYQHVRHITDDNGNFFDIGKILKHLADMPVDEVRKELTAQTEVFVSTGVPMDHINCHHHLAALYTPYFEVIRELAKEYNVPVRNPVPASVYKLITLEKKGGGNENSIKKLILFGITHPFKSIPMLKKVGPDAFIEQEKLMMAEGIKSPDWFIDSFYENATPETFISILQQLPGGVSEIMCHPGMENEINVLTNIQVKNAIDSLQIKMVSFNHLKEPE